MNTRKNLSLLLLTGSLATLIPFLFYFFDSVFATPISKGDIDAVLSLFNNSSPQPLTTRDILYYISTFTASVGGILFSLKYKNDDLQRVKLIGYLFLTAATSALLAFAITHGLSLFSHLKYTGVQMLISLITIASYGIAGFYFAQENVSKVKVSWAILILGGVTLLSLNDIVTSLYRAFWPLMYRFKDQLLFFIRIFEILAPLAYIHIGLRQMKEIQSRKEGNQVSDSDLNNELLDLQTVDNRDTFPIYKWVTMFLLTAIPFIGIFVLLYWSVSKFHKEKGSWAAANICVSFLTTIITLFLGKKVIEATFSELAFYGTLIAVVIFYGLLISAAIVINGRNQQNSGSTDFSVAEWLGYSALMLIPLVNLICLIIFSTQKENRIRRQWAIALLVSIPFYIISIQSSTWLIYLQSMSNRYFL